MKALILSIFLLFGYTEPTEELKWYTDYNAALEVAAKENKIVLVNFTGSDWCGWCKKLKAEVFDKEAFAKYAGDNLVLLKIDFPSRRLPAEEHNRNVELAEKYNIEGFPTILLVDKQGEVVLRTGYQYGGVDKYIDHLEKAIN